MKVSLIHAFIHLLFQPFPKFWIIIIWRLLSCLEADFFFVLNWYLYSYEWLEKLSPFSYRKVYLKWWKNLKSDGNCVVVMNRGHGGWWYFLWFNRSLLVPIFGQKISWENKEDSYQKVGLWSPGWTSIWIISFYGRRKTWGRVTRCDFGEFSKESPLFVHRKFFPHVEQLLL